jgi:hypothetical protein
VTFEDDILKTSSFVNTSNSSYDQGAQNSRTSDYSHRQQEHSEPPPPIPPRRKLNNGETPERPNTLDVGPRNRPVHELHW